MKILKNKVNNIVSYLMLLFTVAALSLLFYGQFSSLEFAIINNNTIEDSFEIDKNTSNMNTDTSGSIDNTTTNKENSDTKTN